MDIADLRGRLSDVALFIDFDGVLSEIVSEPAAARPVDGVVDTISALAAATRVTGIVSGRSVEFLDGFFPDRNVHLVGLYGLERRVGGERREHASAPQWRRQVETALARAVLLPAGVTIEPKGGVSLTVHYRQVPGAEAEVHAWARETAAVTGLEVRRAKSSFELHPPVGIDKGVVVAELAGDAEVVVYAGDDVGDLPAFDALAELAATGRSVLRILVEGPETADGLRERADVLVGGPLAMADHLRGLTS